MFEKLKLSVFSKSSLKSVSEEAGIYIFIDKHKKPIYVGKAINLKKRLYSYTLKNLEQKTSIMVSLAKYFSFIKVSSEIEALVLEAKLVGSFRPKYNIQLKDDKSPLYVLITKEYYPRVLTSRRPLSNSYKKGDIFGPFLTSRSVFFILKTLRKIFPYATHKPEKKACFYSHLGLCNPCPSNIELLETPIREELHKKYLKNIHFIRKFLLGGVTILTADLNHEMKIYSKSSDFEKAAEVKSQLDMITSITTPIISGEHFMENPNLREDLRNTELKELKNAISGHLIQKEQNGPIKRIECYDVAHLSGKHPVASMVTFVGGDSDKSLYRHFKINQEKSVSDVDSMFEVGKRRIKHFEDWGVPDLILVDGGKTQVAKMQSVFESFKIPVIGIAKMSASLVIPISKKGESSYLYKSINLQNKKYSPLIFRLKDEAHRFARSLHHKLLQKSYGINT